MKILEIFRLDERHVDVVDALRPYADRTDTFIQFTDLHKLGINPGSPYKTPIGIYAYPLAEMFEHVVENTIPFAGNRMWVIVFQADLVYDLSTSYTEQMWARDRERLIDKTVQMCFDKLVERKASEELVNQWAEEAKIKSPGAYFWNVTRNLAARLVVYSRKNPAATWTGLMYSMGYEGFTDRTGTGIIHDNEPTQAVFFSTKPIKMLEIIANVRKTDYEEPEKPVIRRLLDVVEYDHAPNLMRVRLLKQIVTLLDTGACSAAIVPDPDEFKASIRKDLKLFLSAYHGNVNVGRKELGLLVRWITKHLDVIRGDDELMQKLVVMLISDVGTGCMLDALSRPEIMNYICNDLYFGGTIRKSLALDIKHILGNMRRLRSSPPEAPLRVKWEKVLEKFLGTILHSTEKRNEIQKILEDDPSVASMLKAEGWANAIMSGNMVWSAIEENEAMSPETITRIKAIVNRPSKEK